MVLLNIEQNFVIEVCVKQIFPRSSNSVNSCLSDPLERVYRSLKSKSNTGITKYQASKRGRDEYDRQACSKFNFFMPRFHLKRKKRCYMFLKIVPSTLQLFPCSYVPPPMFGDFLGDMIHTPPPRSNGSSIANSGQSRHPLFCGPHIIEPGHENTLRKNGIKLEFIVDVN